MFLKQMVTIYIYRLQI